MAQEAADDKTIAIDPRVVLQEVKAKAAADAAFYENRCLVLGQTVFDLQQKVKELTEIIAEQNATLAESGTGAAGTGDGKWDRDRWAAEHPGEVLLSQ